MRSCPAAGVRVARCQRQRGGSSCQTSAERGQELPRREWMSRVLRWHSACWVLGFAHTHARASLSQLYPSLCELAHVLSVDGPVRQKLDSLAGELAKAADKELQVVFVSLHSPVSASSLAAASQTDRFTHRRLLWVEGHRRLDGGPLPRALPAVCGGGGAAESSALVHLRTCVHPTIGHPDGADGEGGAGRSPSLRVRGNSSHSQLLQPGHDCCCSCMYQRNQSVLMFFSTPNSCKMFAPRF